MSKQFILRDGEEPGLYPGLGVAEVGKPLTAYGEEQEKAFSDDKRFKQHHEPAEPVVSDSDSSTDDKPAQTGKGKVK